MKTISFADLGTADLVIDAIYEGGATGNTGDDPINRLLPGSGNQGGFRAAGRGEEKSFVVLYTSGEDKDWPDTIDLATGRFIYFGDNKKPGHELHDTSRGGNSILKRVFEALHAVPPTRDRIPPFFVFTKHPTANSPRSVQFRGVAAPGYPGLPPTEDLVALWKTSGGQRFQNYRAVFSLLDIPVVPRAWIGSLGDRAQRIEQAPIEWKKWVEKGTYALLRSEPTTTIRTQDQQSPDTDTKVAILRTIFCHFKESPFLFERFAARIFQMQDQRVMIDEITRGVVDGGRDAIGRYRLGLVDDPVYAEFALEAKCYRPPIDGHAPNTVGVKEVARLVSRLRHRQFGVLVTTSVIARQAYQEVREDRHPIVFIAGKDIADILIASGYATPEQIRNLIKSEYPLPRTEGR